MGSMWVNEKAGHSGGGGERENREWRIENRRRDWKEITRQKKGKKEKRKTRFDEIEEAKPKV